MLKYISLTILIFILLIASYLFGIITTNAKQYPKDPYNFLTPKISHQEPLEIPFNMVKGETIEYHFWITPEVSPSFFYLFSTNSYSPYLSLNYAYPEDLSDFTKNLLVDKVNSYMDKEKLLNIKISKVNQNFTESLIKDITLSNPKITATPSYWYTHISQLGFSRTSATSFSYGYYKLELTVLKTIPELKENNISISLVLQSFSRK